MGCVRSESERAGVSEAGALARTCQSGVLHCPRRLNFRSGDEERWDPVDEFAVGQGGVAMHTTGAQSPGGHAEQAVVSAMYSGIGQWG
jgi:hypothetical protein